MQLSTTLQQLRLLLAHPDELGSIVIFYLWHKKRRDISAQQEHSTSGWNRKPMRRCWELLDMTGRTFSVLIKDLNGDLSRTTCLLYLVLRGLDTIEDDTTFPNDLKQPIMRSFHEKLDQPGYSFGGIGMEEHDRKLLIEFDVVIEEVMLLESKYKDVITDICNKMATGMADFCHKAAASSSFRIDTLEEFDLYCHYVAGLVGEGFFRLSVASGSLPWWFGDQLVLANSLGMFLQKTNILRDIRQDIDEDRPFWPKEICARYGFTDPHQLCAPENEGRALWVLSDMTLDALHHAIDALDCVNLLQNHSVFNHAAIPASMAIATLGVCFMNKNVFRSIVKIRKGQAVQLFMHSNNIYEVACTFQRFARQIHSKAVASDPNFMAISVACCKIEQWVERHFPSCVRFSVDSVGARPNINEQDARSRIVQLDRETVLKRDSEWRIAEGDTVSHHVNSGFQWKFSLCGVAFTIILSLMVHHHIISHPRY